MFCVIYIKHYFRTLLQKGKSTQISDTLCEHLERFETLTKQSETLKTSLKKLLDQFRVRCILHARRLSFGGSIHSKHRHRRNVTSYHFLDYFNFHQ